jgi:hypothetical protein
MNKLNRCLLVLCLVVGCSFTAVAQDKAQGSSSIPHVIQITREYTKPGKSGVAHDKAESAFVTAMSRAKWPTHYVGMTSLSGKQRALFITQYASFEAWEMDNEATAKNAELSAGLERASVADGELLESVDQGVFVYDEELSLRSMADISHQRYLEISAYHVRPGHDQEWRELVKMVKGAYEKAVPSAHWGAYSQRYGGDGGTYLVLTARKTLAELDRGFGENKDFAAAMGADGMKKLNELVAASIESSQHQLFAFNPHMSYVEDGWIKSDPDFWKPKAAATSAAKPAKEGTKAKP